jgi:uncharacterized damage-inducible protein DinB
MIPAIFKRLYIHNDWANGQVLEAASRLSPEDYVRKVGPGWGSVRATLVHLADVDRLWARRWSGEAASPNPDEEQYPSLASLRAAWAATMAERQGFLDGLTEASIRAPVAYRNSRGDAFSQPLWELLYHVLSHSTDHRGHLSVMLTELGQPTEPLDFVFWARRGS